MQTKWRLPTPSASTYIFVSFLNLGWVETCGSSIACGASSSPFMRFLCIPVFRPCCSSNEASFWASRIIYLSLPSPRAKRDLGSAMLGFSETISKAKRPWGDVKHWNFFTNKVFFILERSLESSWNQLLFLFFPLSFLQKLFWRVITKSMLQSSAAEDYYLCYLKYNNKSSTPPPYFVTIPLYLTHVAVTFLWNSHSANF